MSWRSPRGEGGQDQVSLTSFLPGREAHTHIQLGSWHPLPGLVRAPRALLVVDRGLALVVVAEVWAAAAAAASVARFWSCRAFMPVEGRQSVRPQLREGVVL